MTQQINPEAIMQRLHDLLDKLEPLGRVTIQVIIHPTIGGRVTFEVGELLDSNADP